MSFEDLFSSNFKKYLVPEVRSIDLSKCSDLDLTVLRQRVDEIQEYADFLTLEDRTVGYTYHNLSVLIPMVLTEEKKRGMCGDKPKQLVR